MKAAIAHADIVFWDFDGVIKESSELKITAFEQLFLPYGAVISRRVLSHHIANQGLSRFEKLPLYLTWAGEEVTPAKVDVYCQRFSDLVMQAVINAPWVPGAREYLIRYFSTQYFVLVTATPQKEIEQILETLAIKGCFREIYGAPTRKVDAMELVLSKPQFTSSNALVIGDSEADLRAARAHDVPFLLRCTPFNRSLQARFYGPKVDDFNDE
jgi:phosphoglycolate phosphatase-like HAD superfamily hydrolase